MGPKTNYCFRVLVNSYLIFVWFPSETLSVPAESCRLTTKKYNIADNQDCQKYYECLGVTLTEKSCEAMLKFSKETNQCEDKKEVDCTGRVFNNQSLLNPQECQAENEFLCKYGKECISKEQVCNGYFNCLDASDENDCEILNHPKLLVAFNNTIKTMIFNATGEDVFVTHKIPQVTSISAIVYNPINHTVILSDSATKKIYEFDLTTKTTKILVSNLNTVIRGMDLDLVSENLYWMDSGNSHQNVHMMSLRSMAQRHLNTFLNFTEFTDIVVVPEIRTDQSEKHIEILSLDGTGTSVSINQSSSPTDVVRHRNKIFWINSGTPEVISVTIGARYFENRQSLNSIQTLNETGHSNFVGKLAVIDKDVMSIWEELRNSHECSPGNSICSHICIPSDKGLTGECKCPENLKLDEDGISCILPANCSSNQFTCRNWDCINHAFVCNGKDECGDNSDEVYCTPCPEQDHIRCARNGMCIPVRYICDGDKDCLGGQDEVNCAKSATACKPDEFRCQKFGRCIKKRNQCDDDKDCGISDNSDERGCDSLCQSIGKIKCVSSYSNKCINATKICDGENDCPDGSDERNCTIPN